MEEVPISLPNPLPLETNVLLTNLVNLLQQQKERLKHVEEVKEKIPTEIMTQIKVSQRNQQNDLVLENSVSIPIQIHRKGDGK